MNSQEQIFDLRILDILLNESKSACLLSIQVYSKKMLKIGYSKILINQIKEPFKESLKVLKQKGSDKSALKNVRVLAWTLYKYAQYVYV